MRGQIRDSLHTECSHTHAHASLRFDQMPHLGTIRKIMQAMHVLRTVVPQIIRILQLSLA